MCTALFPFRSLKKKSKWKVENVGNTKKKLKLKSNGNLPPNYLENLEKKTLPTLFVKEWEIADVASKILFFAFQFLEKKNLFDPIFETIKTVF